jgi:hypothetical protein
LRWITVLNQTHVTTLDVSAPGLLRRPTRTAHVRGAALLAASLALAGCSIPQLGTTSRSTPPQTDIKGAQQLSAPAKAPEVSPQPAPPTPQHAQRISETNHPAPASGKGAEKLVAAPRPIVARAKEKAPPPHEPAVVKAPEVEPAIAAPSAPVEALIVKGPPPSPPPRSRTLVKALIWLGLGLGAAAAAVVARLSLIRRAQIAAIPDPGKEDLRMPRDMGFKEPLNLPQEPALAEEP